MSKTNPETFMNWVLLLPDVREPFLGSRVAASELAQAAEQAKINAQGKRGAALVAASGLEQLIRTRWLPGQEFGNDMREVMDWLERLSKMVDPLLETRVLVLELMREAAELDREAAYKSAGATQLAIDLEAQIMTQWPMHEIIKAKKKALDEVMKAQGL